MGVKIRDVGSGRFVFFCPGCKCGHQFQTIGEPRWSFDGNMREPTVSPSLRVRGNILCHLVITRGKINFCTDSQHEFAGKTVDMEDWEN